MPPLSLPPTTSSLYLANSLTTVVIDPDLYRLVMFHVPNLISLFYCLGCTEESGQVRGFCVWFATCLSFCVDELLAPRPTPKLEDHPLPAVRDCLFSTFAATLKVWKQFLHLQPEPRHAVVTGTHLSRVLRMYSTTTWNHMESNL